MLALIILLTLLILLLILPVGADAAYSGNVFSLKLKAGPLRFRILPKKMQKPGAQGKKPKKKKKKKKAESASGDTSGKPRLKPGLSGFLELARVLLTAASRLRRHLSVDLFRLQFVSAAPDPYDAIMQYGYLNAGFSVLAPLLHRALKIRDEEIVLDLDVMSAQPQIDAQIVVSFQIWELLYIGASTGFGFLRWFLPLRKAARKNAKQEPQGT